MKIEKRKENLKLLNSLSKDTIQMLESFNKCNKQAKRFIRDMINVNTYFWDYGYMLNLEYTYLKNLRETLLKENLYEGVERDCERIQTCLNLLDIIRGKKSSVHLTSGKTDLLKDINKSLSECKWEVKRYVNTKNDKRFINISLTPKEKLNPLYIDSVYNQKAWYLYHKMKYYWMKGWWS